MIKVIKQEGDVVEVGVNGKLLHDDYQNVLPEFERIIAKHGSIRCLIEVGKITGIEPKALLDDLKFDVKHAKEIRRCAIVSEADWHAWLMRLWGLFMPKCTVKAFKPDHRDEAAAWVRAETMAQTAG
jgi:hypothetical protein